MTSETAKAIDREKLEINFWHHFKAVALKGYQRPPYFRPIGRQTVREVRKIRDPLIRLRSATILFEFVLTITERGPDQLAMVRAPAPSTPKELKAYVNAEKARIEAEVERQQQAARQSDAAPCEKAPGDAGIEVPAEDDDAAELKRMEEQIATDFVDALKNDKRETNLPWQERIERQKPLFQDYDDLDWALEVRSKIVHGLEHPYTWDDLTQAADIFILATLDLLVRLPKEVAWDLYGYTKDDTIPGKIHTRTGQIKDLARGLIIILLYLFFMALLVFLWFYGMHRSVEQSLEDFHRLR